MSQTDENYLLVRSFAADFSLGFVGPSQFGWMQQFRFVEITFRFILNAFMMWGALGNIIAPEWQLHVSSLGKPSVYQISFGINKMATEVERFSTYYLDFVWVLISRWVTLVNTVTQKFIATVVSRLHGLCWLSASLFTLVHGERKLLEDTDFDIWNWIWSRLKQNLSILLFN